MNKHSMIPLDAEFQLAIATTLKKFERENFISDFLFLFATGELSPQLEDALEWDSHVQQAFNIIFDAKTETMIENGLIRGEIE